MKIYQVVGHPIDCEGRNLLPKVLKYYTSFNAAEKYKKDWLALWDKHRDNNDLISPCFYDYKRWLDINEIEVEETYTEI